MAKTVSLLSYSNTFGDWLITTNQIVQEVDNLGKFNYTKDTGLLTINSPGTGLYVANNSLFTGNVVISGTGQSLQVTKDALISGNLVSINDIASNTAHVNVATISLLNVSKDAVVSGNLTVYGNTTINLNEVVIGNITSNSLNANTATVTQLLGTANSQLYQTITDSTNNAISSALALSVALG